MSATDEILKACGFEPNEAKGCSFPVELPEGVSLKVSFEDGVPIMTVTVDIPAPENPSS